MTLDPQFLYSLIVGSALVPNLVSIVVRSHWAGWVKGVIVIVTSLAIGAITAWANGQISHHPTSFNDWMADIFLVTAAAVGAYKLFWQTTGIGPALEAATSPKSVGGAK